MQKIEISVVVPAFNEEGVITSTCAKLIETLCRESQSFEVIVVDDGSTDRTATVVRQISDESGGVVKLIELSRNFGKESALAAGMKYATGAAVLFIDADMQHPIELVPKMIGAWRQGSEVVNAVKRSRGYESWLYRGFSHAFDRLLSLATEKDMRGASDFKLLDRQIVDVLLTLPEQHRFFRGLVAWVGFRAIDIEFDVAERHTGKSHWNWLGLVLYSLRSLVGFSSLPLRLVAFTGFATVFVGVLLLIQTLTNYFTGRSAIGFTTVIAVQILLGGMTIFSVGVVAIYLSSIHDESKRRPIFVVRRSDKK
jgi:dolichol-phosphate mannosyltransferase